MDQMPQSIKEIRLLLRRINKSIRELDSDISQGQQPPNNPKSLLQYSDLIYNKALLKSEKGPLNFCIDEDPANILNELI